MRKLVVLLVVAGAAAFVIPQLADGAKKKKKKPAGGGAAAIAEKCPAACEHRKECKVPGSTDVAACTSDCQSIASLHTVESIDAYIKADCAAVKTAEAAFRQAVGCKQSCVHRAECIADAADVDACTGACVTIGYPQADLDQYVKASCADVKKVEADFRAAQSCLYSCVKIVECGVEGDLPSCFSMCVGNIAKGAYSTADVEAVQKKNCKWIKQNIAINQPQQPQGGGRTASGGNPYQGLPGMPCTGGNDVCTNFNMCCRHGGGGAPGYGQQGVCMSSAICFMPRY